MKCKIKGLLYDHLRFYDIWLWTDSLLPVPFGKLYFSFLYFLQYSVYEETLNFYSSKLYRDAFVDCCYNAPIMSTFQLPAKDPGGILIMMN